MKGFTIGPAERRLQSGQAQSVADVELDLQAADVQLQQLLLLVELKTKTQLKACSNLSNITELRCISSSVILLS